MTPLCLLLVGTPKNDLGSKGDPLADIRILRERKRIQLVMKEGEVYIDCRSGHSKEIVHAEPDSWRKIDA